MAIIEINVFNFGRKGEKRKRNKEIWRKIRKIENQKFTLAYDKTVSIIYKLHTLVEKRSRVALKMACRAALFEGSPFHSSPSLFK